MHQINLDIIPDEEEEGAAEICISGTIEGHKYRFLLDTGAAISAILSDTFTEKFLSTQIHHSSGVFRTIQSDIVQIPEISFGTFRADHVIFSRASRGETAHRNLVGMNLLKDFCCEFLFHKGQLLVGNSQEIPPIASLQDLFLGKHNHPYITLQWDGVSANAVWDTGAGMTVVDTQFIEDHPSLFTRIGESVGTDASGTQQSTPTYQIQPPWIGGSQFPAHAIAAVDFSHLNSQADTPMDMILGYTTIRHGDWWFDFPLKQWSVRLL